MRTKPKLLPLFSQLTAAHIISLFSLFPALLNFLKLFIHAGEGCGAFGALGLDYVSDGDLVVDGIGRAHV